MTQKRKGILGRTPRPDDVVTCAHTALKPLLVQQVGFNMPDQPAKVKSVQLECVNCGAQLRDVSA